MNRFRPQSGLAAALLGLLLVAWALSGCRTPVSVEGDLNAEPFLVPHASLTKDQGGNLFAVAAQGQSLAPLAVVQYEGQTHLFAARAQGQRSAQLFPLTQVDIEWFNNAQNNRPTIEFRDDAAELGLETTVGLWEGGDREHIRWLGAPPESPTRAVVLPQNLEFGSLSMADHIVGTVDAGPEGLLTRHGTFPPHRGPFLLIPDGPLSEAGPITLSLVDLPFREALFPNWTYERVDGPSVSNQAEATELAGRMGAEIIIASTDDDTLRVGFASDGGLPAQGAWRRPVGLADSGWLIDVEADEESMLEVLHALDDLYGDHLLSAAYRLANAGPGNNWSVDANQRATQLRHQDLIAAAGFIPWMRADLLSEQEGLGPDVALFMARAYAYEENWRAARIFADRAVSDFAHWPRRPAAMGMAQTRLILGEINAQLGERDRAIERARQARDDFQRADDTYRAALAERRALLLGASGDIEQVVDILDELGATYAAGRTLLLAAAAAMDDQNDLGLARRHLDHWTDRFAPDAGPRTLSFSWALQDRLQWLSGQRVDPDEVSRRAEAAQKSHAWDAAVTFALTHHARRALYDEVNLGQLGELLVEGTLRSDAQIFVDQIDRTLGVICADVAFSLSNRTESGMMDRECARRIDQLLATPEGLRFLLEGGYRFVQRAELGAAEDLHAYLEEHIADDQEWQISRAETHLFKAVLLEEMLNIDDPEQTPQEVVDAIQAGFNELREGLSPDEAPARLFELAEEFELRSMSRLQVALFNAARQAARHADRSSELYQATLSLASARYQAGHWQELADLDQVESPLHAARIDLYRGHAHYLLHNDVRGAELTTAGVARAEEFGDFQRISVLHLAGSLALERGDAESAEDLSAQGMRVIENLPESLASRDDSQVLEARLRSLKAQLLSIEGDRAQAWEEAQNARQLFQQLPRATAPHIRREVLETAAQIAPDGETFSSILEELETFNRELPEDTPMVVRRDVARTLTAFRLEQGEHRKALKRARSVVGEGVGFGENRRDHHCALGKARLFGGETAPATFHLKRCAAGDDVAAARAELLMAMADSEATASYRAGVARHLLERLPDDAAGEATRLRWMAELPESLVLGPRGHGTGEAQLEERYQQARQNGDMDIEDRLAATEDYLEYLLAAAKFSEADEILQSSPGVFFEPEADAQDRWVIFRLRSMAMQLRPLDFFDYIERAVVEAPPSSPELTAQVHYQRAVAHFQLGQHFPALDHLEEARRLVEPASELGRQVDELESTVAASRFGN